MSDQNNLAVRSAQLRPPSANCKMTAVGLYSPYELLDSAAIRPFKVSTLLLYYINYTSSTR